VAAGVVSATALGGREGCSKPEAAPRVEASERLRPPGFWTETTTLPAEADNLECLLETSHAHVHLEFGYRGCFGGSDNDLDLDVAATASVIGHLWTGRSTDQATEAATLTREQGQAYLRLLVDAMIKEDEANDVVMTAKSFVRVSYQCGAHGWGPFTVMTENPTEEDERDSARAWHSKFARHYPYSRVHGTIAAARKILRLLGER
jgi:hypothetical protein